MNVLLLERSKLKMGLVIAASDGAVRQPFLSAGGGSGELGIGGEVWGKWKDGRGGCGRLICSGGNRTEYRGGCWSISGSGRVRNGNC